MRNERKTVFIHHSSFLVHHFFFLALLCLVISCSCASRAREGIAPEPAVDKAQAKIDEDEVDAALERAANAALGLREGAIVVMDAQNGRVRAVVNPRVAVEQAFPPGSAIKPFTALAAMRAGLLDAETTRACRTPYARAGFHIACTHPKSNAPLDLAHALAFSCNYYFATLGERLSAGAFDATLRSFGFGERTGVNAAGEVAGSLRRNEPRAGDVLGEGDHLLVTPIQLASAYAALTNGGHLYRPQRTAAKDFKAEQLARLGIAAAHRSILLKGMRGAVSYGTAASAGLDRLPALVYGKTGTSSASNGFRTQGWFVGILDDARTVAAFKPESARLVVLVFLRRAHGSESAEVARPVFEEFLRARAPVSQEDGAQRAGDRLQGEDGQAATGSNEGSGDAGSTRVRLKVTSRNDSSGVVKSTMRSITLEEYVAGVLAAESSTENEMEALKAQAVVSRTFALRNLGRHSQEGFDFCSITHCQRYAFVDSPVERASSNAAAIARAVSETRGEVLRDGQGQLADAYFGVACGGMTANIQTLWGAASAPTYLRGVRDDYCASMPHHHWTDTISAQRLLKALRSDPQSDVGARLSDVVITRRDATGRAELITLEGERRRTLSGWDFKLIVGRALGWNLLKSSRFTVTRAGSGFVFRGSGFGHGLGLCQEGAHVMAVRGSAYRQILGKYFPGTSIADDRVGGAERAATTTTATDGAPRGDGVASWSVGGSAFSTPTIRLASYSVPATSELPAVKGSQNGRLVLSGENFRVSYPARTDRREVEALLRVLAAARSEMERRLTLARLTFPADASLHVSINETTADFIAASGQPGWAAAATDGARMELQPLALLRRRGVIATTLRHEYAHFVINRLGRGRTPRWLAEGLAVHMAGEGALLARAGAKQKWTREEIERRLERPASAEEMRALYAAAYREVRALIRAEGESNVWRRVAQNSD
ncbi:MAG TPA: SpoIID/LytB domain-containing protein [Pyrinomonadaceae bacterium]|jgi:stage II sporulation protein D